MNYNTQLSATIVETLGINPEAFTPNEVRIKIENNLDAANAAMKQSIGKKSTIELGENQESILGRINEAGDLYSRFMIKYTEYLDAQ